MPITLGGHFGCITVLCIQSLTSISLFGGSAQGESVFSLRSRGSTFTEYRNTKCWGGDFYGDGDSLRDFTGTAEDCKLKCEELDCPAFIRVHDDSQHSGKCFFRTGTIYKCFTRANTCWVREVGGRASSKGAPVWFSNTEALGWSKFEQKCREKGLRLCTYSELCPGGIGSAPAGGVQSVTDAWCPITEDDSETPNFVHCGAEWPAGRRVPCLQKCKKLTDTRGKTAMMDLEISWPVNDERADLKDAFACCGHDHGTDNSTFTDTAHHFDACKKEPQRCTDETVTPAVRGQASPAPSRPIVALVVCSVLLLLFYRHV